MNHRNAITTIKANVKIKEQNEYFRKIQFK
jgi:hypothetical protein